MENQDKKPNIIAIIGAIVLLVLAVVGLSYAFFSAFIKNGETDTSVEGKGANLSLVYTDGKSVITSSNIMPGWSATKTFTVTNNGEADTYYKLNISNITNEFVEGGLTFSIASTDGGANIDETPVGTEDRTISSSISIAEGKTHTYTITAKYINLDADQTPDLGKAFSYTIGIEASTQALTDALLETNKLKDTITTPGKEKSNQDIDNIESKTQSVSSTAQKYYVTYATGWKANGEGFDLTGVQVTTDTYDNSYSKLLGKYLSSSDISKAGTTSQNKKVNTKNLTSIYYVDGVNSSSLLVKQITSNKNTSEALLASTEDDYGTSYYFRGAVKNNYVEFANMCWRIVRITGNGAIKLVLHNNKGVEHPCSSQNNEKNAAVFTMYTGIFNPDSSTPAYVGFMYGTLDGSNYAENFANTNKSYAMKALEVFYSNSLKMYDDKIADVIWCNDKSIYSNEDIDDDEIEDISFGITGRINNPSLICPNDALGGNLSKYTVNDTIYGNGTLKYKVGLLTADELLFAGYSDIIENKSVYLEENAEGNTWTTLTPYKYMSTGLVGLLKVVDAAIDTGTIATSVSGEYFRPAIALKPNIEISGGTGTSEDPYIVK